MFDEFEVKLSIVYCS